MLQQVRSLRRVWQRDGALEVGRRLLFAVSRVHRFSVMGIELSAQGEGLFVPPSDIEIKEVGKEELGVLRSRRRDLPEYFFRDEWENLDRSWVGLLDGRVSFICFVSYRGSSELISLGPRDAELAYIYSMPELRGRRVSAIAVSIVGQALAREGFEWLWAVPNQLNQPIIRSFERAGLRSVAVIRRYGPFTYPRTPLEVRRALRKE